LTFVSLAALTIAVGRTKQPSTIITDTMEARMRFESFLAFMIILLYFFSLNLCLPCPQQRTA
jgi:hypothetical protein